MTAFKILAHFNNEICGVDAYCGPEESTISHFFGEYKIIIYVSAGLLFVALLILGYRWLQKRKKKSSF